MRVLGLHLCAVLALACQGGGDLAPEPEAPEPGPCLESCGEQSQADLLAAIEGHGDPIAEFIRSASTSDGTLEGDYNDVLGGIGDVMGCDASTERSFVVLSNFEMTPKTVFARCADDPVKASSFFLAAPAVRGTDMDPTRLHMAAWDAEAGQYRHYLTNPSGSGEMRVKVQPDSCMGCHGGSQGLPHWQPLMNEMSNPWSQWNAEPGFSSHAFDADLDPGFLAGEIYQEMLGPERLGSAAELEPLVRAGIDRVTGARLEGRRAAASIEGSLEMVRPIFCDETSNYVSEIHRTGEIRSAAVVDDSLRSLLAAQRPGSWTFATESRFRLDIPSASEETVLLLPVRGESTIEAERSLMSRRILTTMDVLRVRALDYGLPTGSDFRCGLYEDGAERIRAGALSDELAELGSDATNADLIPLVFRHLLQVAASDGSLVGLDTGDETLVAIPDARATAFASAIEAKTLDGFRVSIDNLGDDIANRINNATRGALFQERDARACRDRLMYPNAPLIPSLTCP